MEPLPTNTSIFKLALSFWPTIRNAIYYFGGSIIQLLVSIFTSPIFARNLTAEEFGIIGYYLSVKQFILPLTTLSLTFFYLYKYFNQNHKKNKHLFTNIILFLTLSNIVVACISYAGMFAYFNMAQVSMPFYPFTLIMLAILFFETYKTFLLIDLKLKKEAFTYFIYSAILALFTIGISLLFVVVFQWGAEGRMLGTLVATVALTLLFIKNLHVTIHFKLDWKLIKESLWWAFPMILSAYFYLPMANIDKLLLASLNNTSELGYYSIGFNIASYISTAALALYSAFQPDFYKFVSQKNNQKFKQYTLVYVVIIACITLVFFFFSKLIVHYLTSGRYTRAYIYANYFAVAIFFMSLTQVTNTIIIALGKSRFQLYINIIAGTIGFLLYKYFIARYGFIGANYGRIAIALIYLITQVAFILFLKFRLKPKEDKN